MNRTVKIILIITGVSIAICACASAALLISGFWTASKVASFADANTTRDTQEVTRLAGEIADFTLPEGFSSPYAMHIADFISIGYLSKSGHTHIYLTQFPKNTIVDMDAMMRQLKRADGGAQPWAGVKMTTTEQKQVTMRGNEATLSLADGQASDGETFRVATVTFDGKSGPAFLVISGPADEWEPEMVNALIASFE